MPTVFRYQNVRFHFFSNEGTPREQVHIHAESSDGTAKFWLYPEVTVERFAGFSERRLKKLAYQVSQHREKIERAWHEHFGES